MALGELEVAATASSGTHLESSPLADRHMLELAQDPREGETDFGRELSGCPFGFLEDRDDLLSFRQCLHCQVIVLLFQ